MSKLKSKDGTVYFKEYMLKVRMSEVDIAMLDTICAIEQCKRSEIIRKFIVFAIHDYYEDEINNNKDHDKYLKKLFESYNMLEILEDAIPSNEEIDNDTE